MIIMIQVVVEARDRASSGQANTAHTTIIVEVRMQNLVSTWSQLCQVAKMIKPNM